MDFINDEMLDRVTTLECEFVFLRTTKFYFLTLLCECIFMCVYMCVQVRMHSHVVLSTYIKSKERMKMYVLVQSV